MNQDVYNTYHRIGWYNASDQFITGYNIIQCDRTKSTMTIIWTNIVKRDLFVQLGSCRFSLCYVEILEQIKMNELTTPCLKKNKQNYFLL